MKKLILFSAVGLMTLGGCAVHTHRPPPPVAVRPAVVVSTPVRRVRVRRVRARRCAYTKCRRRCNIWGCWNRCRRVYRRCY